MPENILKRDGEKVPFEEGKITVAIRKAFIAQEEKIANDDLRLLTDEVIFRLHDEHVGEEDVFVEVVQKPC